MEMQVFTEAILRATCPTNKEKNELQPLETATKM